MLLQDRQPFLLCLFPIRFRPGIIGAAAFTMSAVIDSKCVDFGGCQLPGYLIPRLPWPVTLVE